MKARRSERVPLRIPVRVEWKGSAHEACTIVVNRGGALLLSPVALPHEATLGLRNLQTGGLARFRVVWCGDEDGLTGRRVGVALLDDKLSFWGPEYEQSVSRT